MDNIDAIAVQDTGATARLAWSLTPRLDLAASLTHSELDYEAVPGAQARDREDTFDRLGTELVWWPRRMFGVVFELGAEERDSNQFREEYDAYYGGIALRIELDSDRPRGEALPSVRE